ncbi:hypothetical protein FG386_003598 [Cryptosporidium ryanae]|uniref:uncharacterized protein n=1 Tax=Cryptosporidium ryanae TaxID=515981 RepID=UPI00351A9763|nr:hypothetical protein FG386_003598 [Cryptosporidium ryanae]
MLGLKSLIYHILLINLLSSCLEITVYGVPIASEAKVDGESPIIADTGSVDCPNNPCNCCSDKLLAMAEQYSNNNGNSTECKDFLKNLFCTLACNEESSDIGSVSGLIMVISVCEHGCAEILSKCPNLVHSNNSQSASGEQTPPASQADSGKEGTSQHKISAGLTSKYNKLAIGAMGFSSSLVNDDKSDCSVINAPEMQTSKSNPYSLAFIYASSDSKVCLKSSGGFQMLSNDVEVHKVTTEGSVRDLGAAAASNPILASDSGSDASKETNANTVESGTSLETDESKCGFCFSKCCCWPVWSGAFISFAAYLVMAFLAIYWQSALFSLGLKSTHFWKGGGYWLLGSAILGIFVGMIVGGLVSNCFAGALGLGGSLTNLFMCVLLVGRLGAALGGLGGLGAGATIGLMAHSGTISWSVGLVLGLLLGLVVGFSPIARSLKMNDRYIRRGIRQREMRRRSRLSESGHSEVSEASGTDRAKRGSTRGNSSSDSRGHHNSGNRAESNATSSSSANNANRIS